MDFFEVNRVTFGEIKEVGLPVIESDLTKSLLKTYSLNELQGKSIKDKRGGVNNIHSWDLEIKGPINKKQKAILNALLKERRKKKWALEIGIKWMDGMPLTLDQISSFFPDKNLKELLDDLVTKGYLTFEHPKNIISIQIGDNIVNAREYDKSKPKGYNIVTGKLSFEFSEILNDNDFTPTLVATDLSKIGVIDKKGLRKLSLREGLRLFGYPEDYSLSKFNNQQKISMGYDLLGNTVVVPVIRMISNRLIKELKI
jgi:DNA (cytosine-5)-methyltransferase 1